jgi:hypothetical protein
MRKSEIEAWALGVIDRVLAGQPVEDDRVELKAEWIDAKKAARRIAGHANASHGEPALWLIGVDEAGAVPGVEADKFAEWHQSVRSCFDELAPEIERLNVPYEGKTVAALIIETDRAPYVVKGQDPGSHAREVPYRHGTRCDAATRGQLLRLLSAKSNAAELQLVECSASVSGFSTEELQHTKGIFIHLQTKFFVVQPQSVQSVFSSHCSAIRLNDEDHGRQWLLESVTFDGGAGRLVYQCSLTGPSYMWIWGDFRMPSKTPVPLPDQFLIAEFCFEVPHSSRMIAISQKLARNKKSERSHIREFTYYRDFEPFQTM